MNISYNWLKRYINTSLTAEKIAEVLTDIGLEVEEVEKIEGVKGGLDKVVVGEVLTCAPHEGSDHLNVTTVDVGEQTPLQIVCGAPNCRAGLKVICATVGAVLYPTGSDEEFKIKRSKIRGVESMGMLCAEDELGVGLDHDGIMELASDTKVGMSAKEYFGIEDDYLIVIGLTPNRVDAASHWGVARDLAAYLKSRGECVEPQFPSIDEFAVDNPAGDAISVEVKNHEACPRYSGVTIRGCKIAPSPEWMQSALRAVGISPKNNLVDITNYILHELGQPLHAFDAAKIEGGKVVVRTCDHGAKFTTLDGVERELTRDDLMICSQERPMCLAGIYGGMDSGISEQTVDVFLESAYFNPVWVRKSAKRFTLSTDASFRYERGADPNMTVPALKRAALLFKELAGGEITGEVIDIYPNPIDDFRFAVSLDRVRSLIGKQIPDAEIKTIIEALDIKIEREEEGVIDVVVPAYRVDVQREADIIEEVLRIYGYNNVEIPTTVKSTISHTPSPDKTRLTELAANLLTDSGYTEIMSNSLTKAAYYQELKSYPLSGCVKILNPLSNDLNVMRQTLLFNALEAVELNVNHRNPNLKIYEMGNCYYFNAEADTTENILSPYSETSRLAIAVCGAEQTLSWSRKAEMSTFFTLRSIVEKLLARFGINIYSLKSGEAEHAELYSDSMSLSLNGKVLIEMGVVAKNIAKNFSLKDEVYFAEINFGELLRSTRKHKVTVSELSKYPEVKRDLALLIDTNVTFEKLRQVALSAEKKLLKEVSLFDLYQGDKLPAGKKSYALSFILEDRNQTLTDKAIEKAMASIQRQLETQCGATIRG
ncbi:MAG: phenylalanine--tRNA ligase subunit beta [Rikenellaceae bacterium]